MQKYRPAGRALGIGMVPEQIEGDDFAFQKYIVRRNPETEAEYATCYNGLLGFLWALEKGRYNDPDRVDDIINGFDE